MALESLQTGLILNLNGEFWKFLNAKARFTSNFLKFDWRLNFNFTRKLRFFLLLLCSRKNSSKCSTMMFSLSVENFRANAAEKKDYWVILRTSGFFP
jgi:hypothetical protein